MSVNLPKKHAHSMGVTRNLVGGIMDFITSLKFGVFKLFLGICILVLFCLGIIWGSELDSNYLEFPSWNPSPSSLGFDLLGSIAKETAPRRRSPSSWSVNQLQVSNSI